MDSTGNGGEAWISSSISISIGVKLGTNTTCSLSVVETSNLFCSEVFVSSSETIGSAVGIGSDKIRSNSSRYIS